MKVKITSAQATELAKALCYCKLVIVCIVKDEDGEYKYSELPTAISCAMRGGKWEDRALRDAACDSYWIKDDYCDDMCCSTDECACYKNEGCSCGFCEDFESCKNAVLSSTIRRILREKIYLSFRNWKTGETISGEGFYEPK